MAATRFWPHTRWRQVLLVLAVVLVALSFVVAFLVEEPLRRHIEAGVNAQLKGYKVTIGRLDLHPIGLSLDLENSIVVQEANPKPPMAEVPVLSASVQWRSIFRGRLVADFKFKEPRLHIDATQGKKELDDKTPVAERGWQEAALEIYPLKINELKVVNGEVSYKPDGDFKPLELKQLNIVAQNIRNIRSRDREYPSDLHLDAVVFDNATLGIDGNADFLAEPYPGIKTHIDISKLPLSYFTGLIHDYGVIRKGTLSGKGLVEYAPKIKQVSLDDVSVAGVDADYVKTKGNAAETEEMRLKTIQEAKKVSNDPGVVLRAKSVHMTDSTLGWADRTGEPGYRIFASDLDVGIKGFSNQKSEGAGVLDAKGKFNGTGPSTFHVTFRPQTKSPDFDLAVKINEADLRSLNDLLRTKAGIDVNKGWLGYFSELTVRNNQVDGYVKVLFHDLDVYDSKQDKDKPIVKKAYEAVADGVAKVLENRNTEETATKASISGPLENPNASLLEILGKLVENAFFKAILPGLDKERGKIDESAGGIQLKEEKEKDEDHHESRLRSFFHRDHGDDKKKEEDPAKDSDRRKDDDKKKESDRQADEQKDRHSDSDRKDSDSRKVDSKKDDSTPRQDGSRAR